MVHTCEYPRKGHHEKCAGKEDSFPVTKNGQIDCNRVRNAIARASQTGKIREIIKGGIRAYIKRCNIESKVI